MTTKGRPLSIPTITKRLSFLADNALVATTDKQMLDSMCDALDHEGQAGSHSFYGSMVRDLDRLSQRVELSADHNKLLTSVIDSLARYEATKRKSAEIKATVARSVKAQAKALGIDLDSAEEERIRRQVREHSIEAMTAAVRVLLDELDEGNSADDAALCDTVIHLMMVTRKLVG